MDDPRSVYFLDKKGDRDVLQYGGLYKYDIPKYRLESHGICIGLSPEFKLVTDDIGETLVSRDEKSMVCALNVLGGGQSSYLNISSGMFPDYL